MNKNYKCSVCGYNISNINQPPIKCPCCGATEEKLILQLNNKAIQLADEHKIGVAKNVNEDILKQLKENFTGECTEVGMYFAMSRQASREGYPEIAQAFKRIAIEEAEHASKFAELIGEILTSNTKQNLENRVIAESHACKNKKDIADKAKLLNYDAIHDTVHEMCKDEARHKQEFEGILNRYFNK